MPKPFDAATKHLLESDPDSWMDFASLVPDGRLSVLDADLSAVTASADAVIHVDGPSPWLAHFEFQSGGDLTLASRLLRYNVLLGHRHDVPVQSVVILLRTEADGPDLSGIYRRPLPDGRPSVEFHYRVIRAWRKPVEPILEGGLATLPMAPLADVSRDDLPGIIRRMDERLGRETTPDEAAVLWTATYVLMGLRYPADFTTTLLQGVRAMKESTTYQHILNEGRALGLVEGRTAEAIHILLHLGRKRFGPPDHQTVAIIESIGDLVRVEHLTERLLDVASWDELLSSP